MKKFILVFAIIFFLFIGGVILFLTRGLKSMENLEINPIDLSEVADGTYYGTFKGYRWDNKVEIVVKNHKIVKLTVIDDISIPKPEITKELFDLVIENQNVNVKAITGSTITCNAYLKAIENAFNK